MVEGLLQNIEQKEMHLPYKSYFAIFIESRWTPGPTMTILYAACDDIWAGTAMYFD